MINNSVPLTQWKRYTDTIPTGLYTLLGSYELAILVSEGRHALLTMNGLLSLDNDIHAIYAILVGKWTSLPIIS